MASFRLAHGVYSTQGMRPGQEDRYSLHPTFGAEGLNMGPKMSFFGVFDGHGGPKCSQFLSEQLHSALLRESRLLQDPSKALTSCHHALDDQFIARSQKENMEDGSTSLCVLFVGDTMYVANVGDSRAVLARQGAVVDLSSDQKAGRTDERQRIRDAGGFVDFRGRLCGIMAVARAFGDFSLKMAENSQGGLEKTNQLIATPEIRVEKVDGTEGFLIIACDGIWDVMSSTDAAKKVAKCLAKQRCADKASKELVEEALARGSMDNCTAVVVVFTHGA